MPKQYHFKVWLCFHIERFGLPHRANANFCWKNSTFCKMYTVEFSKAFYATHYFPPTWCYIKKINGIASLSEPHSNLEVGLTTSAAALHAASAVTSTLWEFNYHASSGATWPVPHRLVPQNKLLRNIRRRWTQVGCIISSVMDSARLITASRASFNLYSANL